ncbi:MAG: hypothetical protein FWD05_10790 [Oscillospiraceae bacterium]|nr:hypothetical protein [Oscillospiraceae bacterium]
MIEVAAAIIYKYLKVAPLNITPLGGGFYGRVFLVEMVNEPIKVVIKIYLFPHLARREACQLNNANGKQFGLLDIYATKFPLSENFQLKLSFYELFSEITHFYDADVEIDYPRMIAEANELELQMKAFGLS